VLHVMVWSTSHSKRVRKAPMLRDIFAGYRASPINDYRVLRGTIALTGLRH